MELMAGKYEMESGNTRIFIDNLYVLRLNGTISKTCSANSPGYRMPRDTKNPNYDIR